jgi:hypothetical protein
MSIGQRYWIRMESRRMVRLINLIFPLGKSWLYEVG